MAPIPSSRESFFATALNRVRAAFGADSTFEISLCLVMLLTLYFGSVAPFWNDWAVDLSAYYYAGHFYHLGQFDQVYAGPSVIIGPEMPQPWKEAVAADGHAGEQTYPFLYLPWVAAVMAPVAANIDPTTAMRAVLVVNGALVVASVLLAWKIIGRGRVSMVVWLAASLLFSFTSSTAVLPLHLGQIQILVFAAVLLSFERLQSGHPHQAALALALAACLKITPAAFGIIFLWNRCWGGLATLILSCLSFAAINIMIIGWPLHATYFDLMQQLNAQVFLSNIGVSMEGLLFQIAAYIEGAGLRFTSNEYSFPKPAWQDMVVKLGFAAGLVSCWLVTRRLEFRDRIAFQGLILAVLVPLMTPLGWVHYYLLASFMLPVFLANRSIMGWGIFVVYFFTFNLVLLLLQSGAKWQFMPQMVTGVLALLAVLAWSHVLALRAQRTPSTT